MPFYENGDVRIHYEEAGSGFPILVTPGGGLNSRMSVWQTAPFNAMEEFKNDFRCITMDQRNAVGGESTGPVPVEDPWDAFASDQLGLMDHLGIDKFFFLGCCIGGPFVMKMAQKVPDRLAAGVLCQPVGHRPEDPGVMVRHSTDGWVADITKIRPDITKDQIDPYLHNLFMANPDFIYTVSRDFARSCQTPVMVMPDDTAAHPYYASMDAYKLLPNAEITIYPWKESKETTAQAVEQVRAFLKAHVPA